MEAAKRLRDLQERIHHWGLMAIGQFMGTVLVGDRKGMTRAHFLRSLEDGRLIARTELNALTALLIAKGVFTLEEFTEQLTEESEHMLGQLRKAHPMVTDTAEGLKIMDIEALREHTRDWPS